MTELKTLKDLNGPGYGIEQGFYSDSFMVDSHKLKIEAIKWIKELSNFYDLELEIRGNYQDLFFCGIKPEIYECRQMCAWIKHFFNITEDEVR